ncbi:MAG: BON domain-containing protein [Thiogranum sp.]|nr:BON domain-containing protein [Thiogranum sp.]
MRKLHLKSIGLLALVSGSLAPAGVLLAQESGTADTERAPDETDAKLLSEQARLDERTRQAVRDLLVNLEDFEAEELRVEVESGIVTLYGRVGTAADRHIATDFVTELRGVLGVINMLEITPGLERGVDTLPPPD